MPRYIDADKFAKRIEVSPAFTNMGYEGQFLKNIVLDLLNNVPTADVAPKSEVIDEILSLIDDKIRFEVEMYNGFHSLKNGKTLCQERVNALNDIKLIINHQFRAELKNKYTEEKV